MTLKRAMGALLAPLFLSACADDVAAPDVYFCSEPHGTCSEVVTGLIEGAGSTVECAIYSFTDPEIAQAMIDAVGRGVQVWVLYEQQQHGSIAAMASNIALLKGGGVYVREDGNSATMHHKFVIIDGETVATGSFNFTNNANWNNDENLLVLRSPELAGQYSVEFQRVWNEGQ
ncbi:MAG: hypothetical protein AMXMBFR64_29120 [Myxococcales bacterium]